MNLIELDLFAFLVYTTHTHTQKHTFFLFQCLLLRASHTLYIHIVLVGCCNAVSTVNKKICAILYSVCINTVRLYRAATWQE